MARPIPLDTDAPVRSLRAAAGLTQVQLAEAARNAQSTVAGAERRGAGIGLDVLVRAPIAIFMLAGMPLSTAREIALAVADVLGRIGVAS